jgi:hypothetical protein
MLVKKQNNWQSLIKISSGKHKSDNNKRIIQLTDVYTVHLYRASNFWLH